MNSEKGHALPLALLALLVGALVITPFLTHVSTGLIAGGIYGQVIIDQYSAKAGVEYGIWRLQSGESEVPEGEELPLPGFTINDKTVNVTIKNVSETISWGIFKLTTYKIASKAGGTIIEAYLSTITVPEGYTLYQDGLDLTGTTVIPGNVFVTGNVSLVGNSGIHGSIITTGNVSLVGTSKIHGSVITTGNVSLVGTSDIYGNVYVLHGATVTLTGDAKIHGYIRYLYPWEWPTPVHWEWPLLETIRILSWPIN